MSTFRAGVLGSPIGHSLSPVIHNAGYAAAGLTDWSYTARECVEADLAGVVAGLTPDWRGLSLTMPLKRAAVTVATLVSDEVRAIDAANTLVRSADGGWRAENTDVTGAVEVLRAAGVEPGHRWAVLGAGGTTRAVLAAAGHLAAAVVTVYARDPRVVATLRPVADSYGVGLVFGAWPDAAAAGDADVVVSTVPAGVADPVAGTVAWGRDLILFDVLYDPWPTALATAAARAGARVIGGLDLLVAQAAAQFTLFTGVDAPVPAMREAAEAAMSDRRPTR